MDHKETDEDLKSVMKEAGDLLEQLDSGRVEPDRSGIPIEPIASQDPWNNHNRQLGSISKEMLARLQVIDKLASQGYQVKKTWNAIPVLIGSSRVGKSVLGSSQAGFSWIAFFFPFAVCAQIKEWSYFYVAGLTYLVGSVFYKLSGWDPTFVVGLALAWQYGYYFPYLRWLAMRHQKTELSIGNSIVVGLLLSFASVIPSIVFEAIFIG